MLSRARSSNVLVLIGFFTLVGTASTRRNGAGERITGIVRRQRAARVRGDELSST